MIFILFDLFLSLCTKNNHYILANLGFATVFLHCPLNVAMDRNSQRGYQIPEDRIKKMMSFIEFPDPVKFKWEKFSVLYDSSADLSNITL